MMVLRLPDFYSIQLNYVVAIGAKEWTLPRGRHDYMGMCIGAEKTILSGTLWGGIVTFIYLALNPKNTALQLANRKSTFNS